MMSSSGDLVLSFPSEKIPGEEKNIFHNMYLDLLLVLQFLASDYILKFDTRSIDFIPKIKYFLFHCQTTILFRLIYCSCTTSGFLQGFLCSPHPPEMKEFRRKT